MLWYEYPTVAERFDSKIDKAGECHIWTGPKAGGRKSIYGVFHLAWPVRKNEYAHRLALIRKLGRDLRKGEECLHSCDTHACVNPDHLSTGTRQQNIADAVARGRTTRGERGPAARLTLQEVREIIALLQVGGTRQQDIADRYGVSRTAISHIGSGRTWVDVPRPGIR